MQKGKRPPDDLQKDQIDTLIIFATCELLRINQIKSLICDDLSSNAVLLVLLQVQQPVKQTSFGILSDHRAIGHKGRILMVEMRTDKLTRYQLHSSETGAFLLGLPCSCPFHSAGIGELERGGVGLATGGMGPATRRRVDSEGEALLGDADAADADDAADAGDAAEDKEEGLRFGWLGWEPVWAQGQNRPGWLVAWFSLAVAASTMAGAIFPVILDVSLKSRLNFINHLRP